MHVSSPTASPRRLRRVLGGLVVAACAGAGLVGLVAPTADAAPATPAFHPEQDWMGSQVAKHMPRGAQHGNGAVQPDVASVAGLDVSAWQPTKINWASVYSNGGRFAIVKATEGTGYTSPAFSAQYTDAYYAGLVHGAYHFALPNKSSGATQADYFIAHGGGWSKDGKTFPGMLDIEWNPYGSSCYGLSKASMTSWILSFSNRYHQRTTRWPLIYTARSWWSECVGNSSFSHTNPLVLAYYGSTPGPMPYDWTYQTIWQYADKGVFPGDQDRFNGDISRVKALANG